MNSAQPPFDLVPAELLGGLRRGTDKTPIVGATWYTAYAEGDGLAYRFLTGSLAQAHYLTADLLIDGNRLVVLLLTLQEGAAGPRFGLIFSALNQCSARMRVPLEAVKQNRWRYEREGAWLKPMCTGDRVDLDKVDRMAITVLRKSDRPARWCMTSPVTTVREPGLLTELVLPQGALIDELGQSTLHDWPTKSRDHHEVTAALRTQHAAASSQRWPQGFSRWGGWTHTQFEPTGFFRTHHDGRRWWLVDPDGHAFWSAGIDCVRVDTNAAYVGLEEALAWMPDPNGEYAAVYDGAPVPTINYLAANLIRAFGPEAWYERWAEIALGELRRTGFNTVANWSDWEIARAAGFPYVRPLRLDWTHTPYVYRDFPDVFHPGFSQDVAAYAEQLRETANDPAFIGYFLMNEPTWGFAQGTPAAGMLFTTPSCASREVLAEFLRDRYETNAAFETAWGAGMTFDMVVEGEWHTSLTERARSDLSDFSSLMVEELFGGLSEACRAVDPNHLNLGVRYYTVPPGWAVDGMRHLDVFSMNCYRDRLPADEMSQIHDMLQMPILIGEWHFGALDVGLPGSGIGHVRDQAARGQAFRFYTEDAAAKPWCVGVHYFTLYDESALGRFDGENWNIGFLDVCNRPYAPLALAARASHERLYPVALGQVGPYDDPPAYLPRLFL